VVQNLGLAQKEKNRLDMIQELNNYLVAELRAGRTVALLIDEAQKLSDEALEGLCDLSNLETDQEKLLQIVLVGQPEITTKLNKASLRRIKQRIAIHHRLYALQTPVEVDQYIRHRLRIVGYEGPDIFGKEAVEAVWHYSGGTPRLINILCDNALAVASLSGKKKVSPYLIMKAAGGLMLDQGSETVKPAGGDIALLKTKPTPTRISPKRTEPNGHAGQQRSEPGIIPLRDSDRIALSRVATGPAVSVHFFDRLTRAATEAMGPMARRIVGDQILALGESTQAFPQAKLAELVLRVSGEILNETMRSRFQRTMVDEIATLKMM